MIKQILFVVFLSCLFSSNAQPFLVSGKITDAKDNSGLIGVNVTLTDAKDSTRVYGASSDIDGSFIIPDVAAGEYVLNVSYISYKTIVRNIFVM